MCRKGGRTKDRSRMTGHPIKYAHPHGDGATVIGRMAVERCKWVVSATLDDRLRQLLHALN